MVSTLALRMAPCPNSQILISRALRQPLSPRDHLRLSAPPTARAPLLTLLCSARLTLCMASSIHPADTGRANSLLPGHSRSMSRFHSRVAPPSKLVRCSASTRCQPRIPPGSKLPPAHPASLSLRFPANPSPVLILGQFPAMRPRPFPPPFPHPAPWMKHRCTLAPHRCLSRPPSHAFQSP